MQNHPEEALCRTATFESTLEDGFVAKTFHRQLLGPQELKKYHQAPSTHYACNQNLLPQVVSMYALPSGMMTVWNGSTARMSPAAWPVVLPGLGLEQLPFTLLEKVQKRATKMIAGLGQLPYE